MRARLGGSIDARDIGLLMRIQMSYISIGSIQNGVLSDNNVPTHSEHSK